MATASKFTRRGLLAGGLGTIAGATGLSATTNRAVDFSDPWTGHRANVKLRGTLGDGWVYRHYRTETSAVLPGQAPVPLCRSQGLIKAKWTANNDGSHTELLYDTAGLLDWESGAYLESFDNPITGETNIPIHTWDGPRTTTYTVNGSVFPWTRRPPTEPVVLPWRVIDGHAWLDESATFERPHPLPPDEWPLASSGETTVSSISVSIAGSVEDLADPDTPTALHDLRWTALRSWAPWLLLGQREGLMLTVGTGRQLSGPDAVPEKTLEILERQQPNFLESDAPWPEATNGWTRYKTMRDSSQGEQG